MIRKLNYTGRKKIKRSSVIVSTENDAEDQRYFDIDFELKDLRLPKNARVYVEAYHRSGYQRFDYGTVKDRKIPDDRRLKHLSSAATPLFRIKVVDKSSKHGRILASIDKVRPQSIDKEETDSKSLLFVEFGDLGNKIWELDLDADWPTLRLNANAQEISLIAASDERFFSLVYPEVLKQILARILIQDGHTDPDCDDDWPSLWLKLATTLPGITNPPAYPKAEQENWINAAVDGFCTQYRMLKKFNSSFNEK